MGQKTFERGPLKRVERTASRTALRFSANSMPKRTMQFQIEQLCPHAPRPPGWEGRALPAVLWVFIDRSYSAIECGGRAYMVDDSRPMAFSDGAVAPVRCMPPGDCPAACEHMGHLIE